MLPHLVERNIGGNVNKGLAAGLLIAGIILIIYGVNASNSFNSDVSRFFTGEPTDRSIWLTIGGAFAAGVGFYGLFRGTKK